MAPRTTTVSPQSCFSMTCAPLRRTPHSYRRCPPRSRQAPTHTPALRCFSRCPQAWPGCRWMPEAARVAPVEPTATRVVWAVALRAPFRSLPARSSTCMSAAPAGEQVPSHRLTLMPQAGMAAAPGTTRMPVAVAVRRIFVAMNSPSRRVHWHRTPPRSPPLGHTDSRQALRSSWLASTRPSTARTKLPRCPVRPR